MYLKLNFVTDSILIFKSFNWPVYILLESRRRELHSLFCLPLSRPVFRRGNVFLFPEDINQNGYLINPHQYINTQPSMYIFCKLQVCSSRLKKTQMNNQSKNLQFTANNSSLLVVLDWLILFLTTFFTNIWFQKISLTLQI